ncbi:hypothetical protein BCV69DRAFT_63513, partial [Microstroma glucosiphilum]
PTPTTTPRSHSSTGFLAPNPLDHLNLKFLSEVCPHSLSYPTLFRLTNTGTFQTSNDGRVRDQGTSAVDAIACLSVAPTVKSSSAGARVPVDLLPRVASFWILNTTAMSTSAAYISS